MDGVRIDVRYGVAVQRPEYAYDVCNMRHLKHVNGFTYVSDDGVNWPEELSLDEQYKRLPSCCNCGAPKRTATCEYCRTTT